MKYCALFIILFFVAKTSFSKSTDSTRNVQVGDSVKLKTCQVSKFKHIQYYRKTRFTNLNATYNKETGDDFYEYFFLEGDFDAKEMPCEYGGKSYRILSFKTFVDKATGADRPVMFLELGENTVAWVELIGAVQEFEVYLE